MANATLMGERRPQIKLYEDTYDVPLDNDWMPRPAKPPRVWISTRCYDLLIAGLILAAAAVALFWVGALGQP